MKTIGPTIVIRNTDTAAWLITVENFVSTSEQESISITVAVPRSDQPMPKVLEQAAQRAIELLTQYVDQSRLLST